MIEMPDRSTGSGAVDVRVRNTRISCSLDDSKTNNYGKDDIGAFTQTRRYSLTRRVRIQIGVCFLVVVTVLQFKSSVPSLPSIDNFDVVTKNDTIVQISSFSPSSSSYRTATPTIRKTNSPTTSPPSAVESQFQATVQNNEQITEENTGANSMERTEAPTKPVIGDGIKIRDVPLNNGHDNDKEIEDSTKEPTKNSSESELQQTNKTKTSHSSSAKKKKTSKKKSTSDRQKKSREENDFSANDLTTKHDDNSTETRTMSPSKSKPARFIDKPTQPSDKSIGKDSSSKEPLPKLRTDADLSSTTRTFAERHCDLSHLKDGEWYPSSSEDSWKQRAPYLIIAGVWNAGVMPLANALLRHPQIVAANQDGFFLPANFVRYYDSSSTTKVGSNPNTNFPTNATTFDNFHVKVFPARERMYASAYARSNFRDTRDTLDKNVTSSVRATVGVGTNENINKNLQVGMDISPGLVFYARTTAPSILCTAPWVKVVIVLRNPIDRLYQQWVYSRAKFGLKLSLEEWMASEMKLLQTVGVISSGGSGSESEKNKTEPKSLEISEKEAWIEYKAARGVSGGIGRSLYVLQLEEWIDAYNLAGMNPSKEIIVLTTEDIEQNSEHQYTRLIKFLGLSLFSNGEVGALYNTLESVSGNLAKSLLQRKNNTFPPMKEETRKMLRKFFRPYNERLATLLESNGFEGTWNKLWK